MKLRVLAAGLILGVMMTGGVTQAATKAEQEAAYQAILALRNK